MKRFAISTIILLTAFCLGAQAQEKSKDKDGSTYFVARLSWASIPETPLTYFKSTNNSWNYPLAYAYGGKSDRICSTGNICASLDVILTRRIAVTLDLGATFVWKDVYDGVTGASLGRKNGAVLTFLPQFKFYYMTRPVVRLYGDAGLGVTKYIGYDKFAKGTESTDTSIEVAGQFVPFGIEVGKKLFGFAELGIGTAYAGVRGGIGYKF